MLHHLITQLCPERSLTETTFLAAQEPHAPSLLQPHGKGAGDEKSAWDFKLLTASTASQDFASGPFLQGKKG